MRSRLRRQRRHLYTAPRLKEALDEAIQSDVNHLVIDLSDTSFIDSTALGVLIAESRRLEPERGLLAIAGPNEQVRKVLQMTGLDHVFALYATREEALADSVAS
jgi:anti-sigma B factor antagonist